MKKPKKFNLLMVIPYKNKHDKILIENLYENLCKRLSKFYDTYNTYPESIDELIEWECYT